MRFRPPMIRFKQKGDELYLYVSSLRKHDGLYVQVYDNDQNGLFIWPAAFEGFNMADETDVYAVSDGRTKLSIPLKDGTFFGNRSNVTRVEVLADDDDGGKEVVKKHSV